MGKKKNERFYNYVTVLHLFSISQNIITIQVSYSSNRIQKNMPKMNCEDS